MVQSPSDSTWHLNTPKLPNDNQADKPIYLNSCNSPILTMHLFNTIMTFITFLLTLVPLAASVLLSKRILNDPGQKYLESICLPHIKSLTADQLIAGIEHSPFPCEQEIYLLNICTANGTAEIDFLAEQQCLCGSPYFDLILQCDACLYTHGLIVTDTPAQVTSFWSAMQTAECSPSPPYQPFSNLFPAVDYSYQSLSPSLTLAPDRFPNITAVSLYVTQTRSATPGLISGSATGRLTTWTNSNGIRYTPTSTPSQFATSSGTTTTSTGGSTNSSSPAASSSGAKANAGSQSYGGVQAVGGVMLGGLGILLLL